jgi:hypothetical protein
MALYGRCLTLGYLGDDFTLMAGIARKGFSLLDPFPAGRGTYYRPLVLLTLLLEERAGGGALLHHAVNLALHLVNGALLYTLLRVVTKRRGRSLALALLFLCHPATVADVYWISGRTDTLCAAGYLAALLGMALFLHRGYRSGLLMLGLGAVTAALSKEMGLTLAGVLVPFLVVLHGPEARHRLRSAWIAVAATLIVAAGYGLLLFTRFYQDPEKLPELSPLLAVRALVHALSLLVVPLPEYRAAQLYHAAPGAVLGAASLLGLLGVAAAAWTFRRSGIQGLARLLAAGALVLVPVLPLIVNGGASGRLVYVPVAALLLASGCLLADRPLSGRAVPAGWALLVAACAGFAWAGGSDWVTNNRLADACARSYAAAVPDAASDPPVLLLTYPDVIHDIPMFTNDASGALHHHVTGRFGYLQGLRLGAGLISARRALDGQVQATDAPAQGIYARSLRTTDAYFNLWEDARLGETHAEPFGTVTVTAADAFERVSAFRVVLSPEARARYRVLHFVNERLEPAR